MGMHDRDWYKERYKKTNQQNNSARAWSDPITVIWYIKAIRWFIKSKLAKFFCWIFSNGSCQVQKHPSTGLSTTQV